MGFSDEDRGDNDEDEPKDFGRLVGENCQLTVAGLLAVALMLTIPASASATSAVVERSSIGARSPRKCRCESELNASSN